MNIRSPLLALTLALVHSSLAGAQSDVLNPPVPGDGIMTMTLTGDAIITRALSPYVEPAYLEMIERIRSADMAFTNLEVLLHDYEPYPAYQSGGTWMRADPAMAEELVWAGFDMVSFANNHTGDYGPLGARLTRQHARAALGHIFDPFFTTKGRGEGTGLGLATAYGIVKQSGGSIWASSEVASGTTFRIYLPVLTQEPSDAEPVEEVASDGLARGTETILVVEDEAMVRVLTSRILRDLGYSVIEAEGAETALSSLREAITRNGPDAVDLVLSDVVMPEMSGPDLVKNLTEIRPGLKVILMSGYSYGSVRGDDLPKHYLCLEKPLTRADLASAVRQTLDHSRPPS